MINQIVFMDGEQYFIVGFGSVQAIEREDEYQDIIMIALNKIETASLRGISTATWIDAKRVTWVPTQSHYYDSDWYLGVQSGHEEK